MEGEISNLKKSIVEISQDIGDTNQEIKNQNKIIEDLRCQLKLDSGKKVIFYQFRPNYEF